MGGANELEHEIDQREVVDTHLVLPISETRLHGDQSERAQQLEEGVAEWVELRAVELGVAHAQETCGAIEPGGRERGREGGSGGDTRGKRREEGR